MTPRENVLSSLRREKPDLVPRELKLTPPLLKEFKKITGSNDPTEYFKMEMREVKIDDVGYASWHKDKAKDRKEIFRHYLPSNLPEGTVIDEWWGIAYLPGSLHHFVKMEHPLRNLESIKELERYPFPESALVNHQRDRLKQEITKIKSKDLAVVGFLEMTIFEVSWYMRGMENLFTDFATNKDFASFLLDEVTRIRCEMAKLFADTGVDVIKLGDDVGTQRGLLMSPDTWREWLKPRLAKVIQSAKDIDPAVCICYHSDGNIEPIISELIEIGVDVLNPVQPECMDPVKIKERYGDRLAFWGTIGTQTTMPFGSVQDVKDTVKKSIEKVGRGGGLIIAPTHVLEPEVPWKNILAFIDAVEQYGG